MDLRRIIILVSLGAGLTACEDCKTTSSSSAGSRAVAGAASVATSTAKQCPPPTPEPEPPKPQPEPPKPPPPEPEPPKPEPPKPPVETTHPLLWEASRADGKAWTTHTMNVVKNEVASSLMGGAADVEQFCPRYHTLTNHQRANFWGLLVSAMVKYESSFNPTLRYKESTMGTDPVTGQHVYSEGLLQLSYQDTQWASYCEFDWSKDKHLAATDPKKTIFDPYKNLSCGIKILARQVVRRGKIAVKGSEGAYWAVLIPGGKYTKVPEIAALTKKMPGCQ